MFHNGKKSNLLACLVTIK